MGHPVQSSTLTADTVVTCLASISTYMSHLRTNEMFKNYIKETEDATSLDFAGGASMPKRHRQAPKSMEGFVCTEALPFNETDFESQCDTLKMQYFEGIDIIQPSMKARFKQEGFHTVAQIEHLLISAVNGEEINEDWTSLDIFKQYHEQTLQAELVSLPRISNCTMKTNLC